MAVFKINPHTHDEFSIEAERFQLANDYWHFFAADDTIVYVVDAKTVEQIERARN